MTPGPARFVDGACAATLAPLVLHGPSLACPRNPGYCDVTIEGVCEPVVWTIFRGGGILGAIRFEPDGDD